MRITHFGKHSRFVRRIDVAIMIEQNGAYSDTGRRLKIDVTRSVWGEDSAQQKGGVRFSNYDASNV